MITPLDIDSSSPESGNELAQAVEQHGMLDGLWLNAAIAELDGLQRVNAENYRKIMDINMRGPTFTTGITKCILEGQCICHCHEL